MSASKYNGHVRNFAQKHGLRVRVREDGELIIPVGPRRRNGEAWYAGRCEWAVYVVTSKPSPLSDRILAAAEASAFVRDGELEFRVAEDNLLDVLRASPLTRPHLKRKVVLSPEQVERRRRQMRAVNARRAGLDLHRGSDETSALVGFRPDPAPPVKGLQPASWPDPRDGQSGPALSPVA